MKNTLTLVGHIRTEDHGQAHGVDLAVNLRSQDRSAIGEGYNGIAVLVHIRWVQEGQLLQVGEVREDADKVEIDVHNQFLESTRDLHLGKT